jgi:uncharacterized membrane protein
MPESPIATSPPLAHHVRRRSIRHDQDQDHAPRVNVGDVERLACGSGLVLYGIKRGTLGGLGLALLGGALVYRGVSGHCNCYEALGLDTTYSSGPRTSVRARHGVKVDQSVTILRPREELYRFWRDFSNLPRVMCHLESVQPIDDKRSHWAAKGPAGTRVEWDAEIITERANELIGWRSVGDSEVDTAGSVHFTPAPGDRGTEVKVALKYDPPAGQLGAGVAWMLGQSPAQQIREDLRRFKQIMETGTVPTIAGQPQGSCR